jgi:chromosome segregation ATPase
MRDVYRSCGSHTECIKELQRDRTLMRHQLHQAQQQLQQTQQQLQQLQEHSATKDRIHADELARLHDQHRAMDHQLQQVQQQIAQLVQQGLGQQQLSQELMRAQGQLQTAQATVQATVVALQGAVEAMPEQHRRNAPGEGLSRGARRRRNAAGGGAGSWEAGSWEAETWEAAGGGDTAEAPGEFWAYWWHLHHSPTRHLLLGSLCFVVLSLWF